MVSEVRAGTTSPMPDHKGFKLQKLVNFQKFSTVRVNNLARSCCNQLQTSFGRECGVPTTRQVICTSKRNWTLRDMLVKANYPWFFFLSPEPVHVPFGTEFQHKRDQHWTYTINTVILNVLWPVLFWGERGSTWHNPQLGRIFKLFYDLLENVRSWNFIYV